DGRIARRATVGADVEIGQSALEQKRDQRADRVAIIKDGNAMFCAHTCDLRLKGSMIRAVKIVAAKCDVGLGRLFAVLPDRIAVKVAGGDQAGGVLAGVEADTGWVAVGVDDIAMEGCAYGR